MYLRIWGDTQKLKMGVAYSLVPEGEYKQLQAENKRLKEALEKYGKHHHCDCQAILVESKGKGKGWYPAPCSCGFEQALKGGK